MHKDDRVMLAQYQVWSTWKHFPVKPEPQSKAVHQGANRALRPCVHAPDAGHHPATNFGSDYVHGGTGMSLVRTSNCETVGVEYSMLRTHRSELVDTAYV